MSIDTRYNSRYLGGKPDALIAGSNVELSNRLTLQRRPGLDAYGPAIPAPDFFFSWQQASLANFVGTVDPTFTTYPQANLQLIVDTSTNGTSAPGSIYNYSPQNAGIILNKASLSQQSSLYTVVNTMYIGDGVDLYKMVGANLLTQSNALNNAAWTNVDTTFTGNQTDPTGASNASYVVFSLSSTTAKITQVVTPNYTPVSNNTFTFSIWMKADAGTPTIFLELLDSTGTILANVQETLSTGWKLYQITGVASNGATSVTVSLNDPSSTSAHYFLYGAQLEVGGPATPTTITLNKPNGVYLWGIQAPLKAPTFTSTSQTGSTEAPWQPDHAYSQTALTLTAVAATVGGSAVYTGTISGGGSNAFAGRYVSITGFVNTSNNSIPPGFICSASTATTLILNNPSAVAETHAGTATLLDTIVDSNGNLEVAYTPGTSGSSQPIWAVVQGQSTSDGLQNLVAQTNTFLSSGPTGSVAFLGNVTATNTKLIFIAVANATNAFGSLALTDSSGDTPVLLTSQAERNFKIYLYYVLSATAGATTISFTGGGSGGTWIGVAEIEPQSATDVSGSNGSFQNHSASFTTGTVNTTNQPDVLFTFAMFQNDSTPSSGIGIGNVPIGFQGLLSQAQVNTIGGSGGSNTWNIGVGYEVLLSQPFSINPTWSITNPSTASTIQAGITASFKSSVGTLVWYNVGQTSTTGLTPLTGYTYYYSLVNTYTGHRSNVSPLSASTGPQVGVTFTVTGTGCVTTPSGTGASLGNGDPQVDAIEVYRNTDGGGFWFQIPPTLMTSPSGTITDANGVLYLKNPGTSTAAGTWSFVDSVPDTSLNTQIFAPIAFLNSIPPAGLTNLEFFDGRLWGSVANILYYATAADDAILINILQNGVSPESWEPTNFIPFNSQIVRSIATGVGLVVFTTTDVWVVSGTNLSNYNPVKVLTGIGLGTYNGVCIDGSTMMLYTRDRQCLMFNVNAGAAEIGFLIGDLIETDINPMTCYLARHVKGSQDNAFYFADGVTGWFRLNPNQYGASASGEQTPIWSPFATIAAAGGAGAIASIEVQPGIKQLLVGQTVTNTGTKPILNRDINTFTDNGTAYTWSATIGSIMLALAGKLAEIESVTTEMTEATATQCSVGVLIDEIAGSFEFLGGTDTNPTNDPPQLPVSASVLSNRFYLSQGTVPPLGRHMQIQLTGAAVATRDELLALTVRGALVEEQQ